MAPTHKGKNGDGKKHEGETKRPGRQNAFSGERLEFLDGYKDQFLDSRDHKGFYTVVARDFIEKFGYSFLLQGNPAPAVPGGDNGEHTPMGIDSLLPPQQQNVNSDNPAFIRFRKVSHSSHNNDVETHHLLY